MFDVTRSPSVRHKQDPLVRALHRYLVEQVGDREQADELLQQTLLRLRFGGFTAKRDPVAAAFAVAQRLLVAHRLAASHSEGAVIPPRVLVVDDGKLAPSIELALSDRSEVTVVTSPDQAVTLIASGMRFDVILCGLLTPACEGLILYCDLLREAPEMADA